MNLVFLIDNDYIFHPQFLDHLFTKLTQTSHSVLIGIITTQSPAPGLKGSILNFKRKFIFIGGLRGFLKLVWYKLKDFLLHHPSLTVTQACKSNQINYFKTNNVNSATSLEQLRHFKPDLLFSFQGHVLKGEVLNIPSIACINKHSGLLPRYRGVWPVFWTLLNQEKKCGVTLHLMNEKIDDGDILCQKHFDIGQNDTVYTLYEKIYGFLPDLIMQVIADFQSQQIVPQKNEREMSNYFGFPTWGDILEFRRVLKRNVI